MFGALLSRIQNRREEVSKMAIPSKPKTGLKKVGLFAAAAAALTSPVLSTNPAKTTPAPAPGLATMSNGCTMLGSETAGTEHGAENKLKNRFTFPMMADIDASVTLNEMLKSGSEIEFDTTKAATIDGYISEVKAGGIESCNCHADTPELMDTHIYVSTSTNATDSLKKNSAIIEITPRIRTQMKAKGEDWTTEALKKKLKGKHVRISGWLFYDKEHENAAENIAVRPNNWRKTCWEIHPVTKIDLIP